MRISEGVCFTAASTVNHIVVSLAVCMSGSHLRGTDSSARVLIRATHIAGCDEVTGEEPNQLSLDTTAVPPHIVLK